MLVNNILYHNNSIYLKTLLYICSEIKIKKEQCKRQKMARGVINTYFANLYKHYMYKHLLSPKEQMDNHKYVKHIKK